WSGPARRRSSGRKSWWRRPGARWVEEQRSLGCGQWKAPRAFRQEHHPMSREANSEGRMNWNAASVRGDQGPWGRWSGGGRVGWGRLARHGARGDGGGDGRARKNSGRGGERKEKRRRGEEAEDEDG